jgi:hypothetical protein
LVINTYQGGAVEITVRYARCCLGYLLLGKQLLRRVRAALILKII